MMDLQTGPLGEVFISRMVRRWRGNIAASRDVSPLPRKEEFARDFGFD